ncbi:gamma-glutamylcyclotransferase family protein [Paracoccus methylarcula]|uniref:Gamma-glutamylcyclotransferase n=1 Tax=Paracoccus methylarcula TaxID=72022 RepID=A0A3R7Q244_9RHOB|nr:gamma-glutamylcyclotransferase family protein [Paracoccus methylarcula]RNF34126.1 gamma-glutamylcyclotransferase [Paracoccus methylarcula]
MSIFYFAYGSNMLPARLAARCPSAKLIGRAHAPGYRVRFAKRGMDGSAKATLVTSEGAASGVLFTLDPKDLAALDRAEGAGRGYDRLDDFSIRHDGQSLMP